jgi:uncharacterized RDD family membrane protein YckC
MEKINPYSSPNTPPQGDVRYAGFWLRVVASILDGFVLVLLGVVLGAVLLAFQGGVEPESNFGITDVLGILIGWLYYTILESSDWQATLGKKAVGIKVTDMQGEKIGFGRANARYWSKILSSLILMIGFLMVAFTEKKQGLHDMIASTLVVKKD